MATPDEVYDRMPEEDRRGVIAWVMAQGRHLEQLDEWTMEDNFTTTEGTAEVYARYVLPHEDDDRACDCTPRHDTYEDNKPHKEEQ